MNKFLSFMRDLGYALVIVAFISFPAALLMINDIHA